MLRIAIIVLLVVLAVRLVVRLAERLVAASRPQQGPSRKGPSRKGPSRQGPARPAESAEPRQIKQLAECSVCGAFFDPARGVGDTDPPVGPSVGPPTGSAFCSPACRDAGARPN